MSRMVKEYIIKVDESKKDIMGGMPLEEPPKELVRCKDCKHGDPVCGGKLYTCDLLWDGLQKPDFFCGDGQRKDGEQE